MRVTVIATGRDGDRMRRDWGGQRGSGRIDDVGNVTPLRRESAEAEVRFDRSPAAERHLAPPAAPPEQVEMKPMREPEAGPPREPSTEEFFSPYEDELDVPTFLRRGARAEDDEDLEEPAFLRRSAD